MRITRAYTIDFETKEILDRKPNKSQFVCQAVKKLNKKDVSFDLIDVPTLRLYVALQSRFDQFDAEYSLLQTLIAMYKPS